MKTSTEATETRYSHAAYTRSLLVLSTRINVICSICRTVSRLSRLSFCDMSFLFTFAIKQASLFWISYIANKDNNDNDHERTLFNRDGDKRDDGGANRLTANCVVKTLNFFNYFANFRIVAVSFYLFLIFQEGPQAKLIQCLTIDDHVTLKYIIHMHLKFQHNSLSMSVQPAATFFLRRTSIKHARHNYSVATENLHTSDIQQNFCLTG